VGEDDGGNVPQTAGCHQYAIPFSNLGAVLKMSR
jgi:hypothetical protein